MTPSTQYCSITSTHKIRLRTTSIIAPSSRHISSDLHIDPVGTTTGGVNHTGVRPRAVAIDLMQRHRHLAAGTNLRELAARKLHYCGCTGLDIVVAPSKSLAAGISGGAFEACGVLLEGFAAGSVARSGGVD